MEPEMKSLIEETVMEILKKEDTEDMREFKIVNVASEMLRTDLSKPEYRKIIRSVIQSFFISLEEEVEPVAESPIPPTITKTEENKPNKISNEAEERIERKPSIAAEDKLIGCKFQPFKKRKVIVEDCKKKVFATKYKLKDPEQCTSPSGMEPEMKSKIEETVMEILNKGDSNDMSELKVLSLASEKLGMDLSGPDCQELVELVIENFLISMEEVPVAEPAAAKENKTEEITEDEGIDEYGNAIICKPSSKREEMAQDFEGKPLLIKEHFQKDGEHFPLSRDCNIALA